MAGAGGIGTNAAFAFFKGDRVNWRVQYEQDWLPGLNGQGVTQVQTAYATAKILEGGFPEVQKWLTESTKDATWNWIRRDLHWIRSKKRIVEMEYRCSL